MHRLLKNKHSNYLSKRCYYEKMVADREMDAATEAVLLAILYTLIGLFLCCHNYWIVSAIEVYLLNFLQIVLTDSTMLLYSSMDLIAPVFIIWWFVQQAQYAKSNLNSVHLIYNSSPESDETFNLIKKEARRKTKETDRIFPTFCVIPTVKKQHKDTAKPYVINLS